jgi:predicted adenylyl cyclase CyaB
MEFLNVEIKARINNPEKIRDLLIELKADYKGLDHQIDTYFNVTNGRLKLREGNIENHLIHYFRNNQREPKESHYSLFKTEPSSNLKTILVDSLDVMKIVDKKREIYFIDNVKFHIDTIETLGNFFEIEAVDQTGSIGKVKLLEQCNQYLELFGIKEEDLLTNSYSDMIK